MLVNWRCAAESCSAINLQVTNVNLQIELLLLLVLMEQYLVKDRIYEILPWVGFSQLLGNLHSVFINYLLNRSSIIEPPPYSYFTLRCAIAQRTLTSGSGRDLKPPDRVVAVADDAC